MNSPNDLLSKDYPIFGTSLEVKTKMPSNIAFKVAGLCDTKSQAITGDIEAKYSDHKNGLVFTETWMTANVLKSQLELENYLAKGLKLDFATTLAPDTLLCSMPSTSSPVSTLAVPSTCSR